MTAESRVAPSPRKPAARAARKPRGQAPGNAPSLADFLFGQLRARGRGVHVGELEVPVVQWLIRSALDGDDRFELVPGGKYELRDLRAARHEAAAREPEEVEGIEWASPPPTFVIQDEIREEV
jgi:hypothetical protein